MSILKIKKLYPNAKLPTRDHHDDAGLDLYAYGTHTIPPHTTVGIPIGVAFEIEKGCVGLIWDKSGIGKKGLKVLGGVVDAGYRGEVQVIMHNLNDEPYTFEDGHKVAQMLIQKIELPEPVEVEELSDSERGTKAFGSMGK